MIDTFTQFTTNPSGGLTVRQYYASRAMQGLAGNIAAPPFGGDDESLAIWADNISRAAFALADSMGRLDGPFRAAEGALRAVTADFQRESALPTGAERAALLELVRAAEEFSEAGAAAVLRWAEE